jgi:hypothetical protein
MDEPDKRWRPTPARPVEIDFIDPSLGADALVARRAILSLQLGDIADSIASIQTQIATAEAAESNGRYRDAEWVRRVRGAQRHYERQHREHCRALENLSRRIAHLENAEKSREAAFVAMAEELLPAESLREIWRRVEAGDDAALDRLMGAAIKGKQSLALDAPAMLQGRQSRAERA